MHSYACSSRRHHRRYLLEGKSAHSLEKSSHLRVLFQHSFIHVAELSAPRHEHRQYILLDVLRILPVILQNSVNGHLLQKLTQTLSIHTGKLNHLIQRLRLTHSHLQCDFRHFIGTHCRQSPVLRIVFGNFLDAQLLRYTIRNHFR